VIRKSLVTAMMCLAPLASTQATDNLAAAEVASSVDVNDEAARQAEALAQQVRDIILVSGLTGLGEQARNVAQQILLEQNALIGQQYDVVDRLSGHWSPVALEQRLDGIVMAMDELQRDELLTLLSDQSLTRARQKEQSAIVDQSSESYQTYIQRLRAQPPGAARVALIAELDRAMQFSSLLVLTRQQVYPQLQAVLTEWQPPEQWQEGVRQSVQEFLLYVHRTTPNTELQKLIGLYRTPVMEGWLASVKRTLSAG